MISYQDKDFFFSHQMSLKSQPSHSIWVPIGIVEIWVSEMAQNKAMNETCVMMIYR